MPVCKAYESLLLQIYEVAKLMAEEAVREKRRERDPERRQYWQGRADAARAVWLGCLEGNEGFIQLRRHRDQ